MALFLVFTGNTFALVRKLVVACEDSVRRWRTWLAQRTEKFEFHLRSVFPTLARHGQGEAFWAATLRKLGLPKAMAAVCHLGEVVP